jgi:DNA (cytosine-5)-methyltransferase 1
VAEVKDYPAHLAAMWQKHLAPREPDAPTVISTFAGAGGSSLGYSMAGFRELLAVEWDDNAVETFRLNFPGVPVYHGDIAKLSVDECLDLAGIAPGELDILDGSPPCQGFSTAGKRLMDDPRNQLFREYVRLLRGLRPKVFVMENVSGMVKGKMKLVFVEILKELKASGYQVSAKLLNAMYFHVPQSRERMIFIGVRDDLGIASSHPKGEARVLNGSVLLPPKLSHLRFLSWRNKGRKDDLRPIGAVPVGITKKGIDLEGRFTYSDSSVVKMFQSYPTPFAFVGNNNNALERIGNSVPPLFMEAIARHIRLNILEPIRDLTRE